MTTLFNGLAAAAAHFMKMSHDILLAEETNDDGE
jgi:hypothetical protein